MAKSFASFTFVAAICFLSLVGLAQCQGPKDYLYVVGKVYCDTCRASFETSVTKYIEGAKIKLECRNREGGSVTYSLEGVTDAQGAYKLPIEGDHEDEVCEVILVKSPLDDCKEILKGRDQARVLVTSNNGMTDKNRYANPLGYLAKTTLPECPKVLKSMGMLPTAMIPN